MFFTTISFPQNIVIGGNPLRFIIIIDVSQNFTGWFFSIVFIFFIFIIRRISLGEYSNKYSIKIFGEIKHVIVNHPLLFNEESPKMLFIDNSFFNCLVATKILINAIPIKIVRLIKVIFIIKIILVGRIFCQVIINIRGVSFNSIRLINFIYHKWVGHLPIFIIIAVHKTIWVNGECCIFDAIKIQIEHKTWVKKYKRETFSLSFDFFFSFEIRKHIDRVFISKITHKVTHWVLQIPIREVSISTYMISLKSLTLKKLCSFKL